MDSSISHFRRLRFGLLAATITFSASAVAIAKAAGDPSLPNAARIDNSTVVSALLKQKADVNATLDDGTTALHWAAANDDLALIQLLLKAGANPKTATRVGAVTPLDLAASAGDSTAVLALIAAGADPNIATENGTTPLMFAAQSGSAPAVIALLDHGATIDTRESIHGQTALMFAAAKDRANVIRVLIKRGADPKLTSTVTTLGRQRFDDDGNPIGAGGPGGSGGPGGANGGTGRGRRGAGVEAGAANGATANGSDAPGGSADTPSGPNSKAAGEPSSTRVGSGAHSVEAPAAGGAIRPIDSTKIVDGTGQPPSSADVGELPATGSGRRTRGQRGGTAGAANAGGAASVASTDAAAGGFGGGFGRGPARTFGGNTALTLAAREGNIAAIRALLEAGADINQGNAGDKTTPIVTAICNGHYDVAKYLLDHGADPNIASVDGLAALYAVIDTQWAPVGWAPNPITDQESTTYLDLMKALLDKGANPNAQIARKLWFRPTHHDESWINAAGATPFWRAAQSTDLAAMRLLIAHHADPKIATNDGVNPLMVAAGLGWNGNYSTQGPDTALATVTYCLTLGLDVTAENTQGYTALGGAAYRGDNDLIKLLVARGAKLDTRTKRGWSLSDMANGPSLRSSVPVPHPQTVALLLKLGAPPLTAVNDEEILGVIRRRPATATADSSTLGTTATPAANTIPADDK